MSARKVSALRHHKARGLAVATLKGGRSMAVMPPGLNPTAVISQPVRRPTLEELQARGRRRGGNDMLLPDDGGRECSLPASRRVDLRGAFRP